jgi:GT2 family glycosyltransferase
MPARTRISRRDHHFIIYGMGANFAARRRLFETIGGFDEVLGGGGPLRSSQDHDLSYRAYQAGLVTLLEPSVVVVHFGVRYTDQWPGLERAYAIGDAAFRMKHVRCGDPFALLRLFGLQLLDLLVRVPLRVARRKPNATGYLRGFIEGVRLSLRYDVDRRSRLYRAR